VKVAQTGILWSQVQVLVGPPLASFGPSGPGVVALSENMGRRTADQWAAARCLAISLYSWNFLYSSASISTLVATCSPTLIKIAR